MNDNSNLNVKSDSRVEQQTLKHQALAGTEINFTISHNYNKILECTEINFTISHNYNKILEYDWLPERSIFNQIQELD